MKASFWHGVWEKNTIGFHQDAVHPFLTDVLAQRVIIPTNKEKPSVFVPLCGKSLDMFWWAERATVVGNELSDIACRNFFEEQKLESSIRKKGEFTVYAFDEIALHQGDFFALKSSAFSSFSYIYDRAALIALPKEMQQEYCRHLCSFIGDGTSLFLISLEFPEKELEGPPFPVYPSDIESLFQGFDIELLAERDVPEKQFARRRFDVRYLREKLYEIKKAQ